MKRINRYFFIIILSFSPILHVFADGVETILQKADSLYGLKQYEMAIACYKVAADSGMAVAQFDLAYALYNGEGIDRDYTSAALWFKRAANQNFAKAQYNLAYCYMNGRGVPRNYDKALDLLTKAANNNYKVAQETLADCYGKGVLVEQNEETSKMWKSKAEAMDDSVAKPSLVQPVQAQPAQVQPAQAPEVPKRNVILGPKQLKHNGAVTGPTNNSQPAVSTNNPQPAVLTNNSQPTVLANNPPINTAVPAPPSSSPAPTPVIATSATPSQNVPSAGPLGEISLDLSSDSHPLVEKGTASINKVTAPIIKILYPEDQSMFHTKTIKLKYQLMAGGLESSTKISVMVDGQRQSADRAVRAANMIDVDLPDHDCTIMMYAQNENGNSEPAMIRLVRENDTKELPRLFVVAIGVGDYNDAKLPKLQFTCKDAKDFSAAIASKKGKPFEEVQVKTLCDSEATRAEIFEAMEWLKQESAPNDVCVFFFAGHGYRDEKDRFYFMPYEGHVDKLYECFSASDFRSQAEEINGKFVVFVDACYSGGLLDGNRSAATNHFIEQLRSTKNGMMLFASSASDTKSKEDPTWGNGAFTKALVEAFNGAAKEEGEEGLSTQDLEHYLYKMVRKTTNFKQTPIFLNPSGMEHFNLFLYGN